MVDPGLQGIKTDVVFLPADRSGFDFEILFLVTERGGFREF